MFIHRLGYRQEEDGLMHNAFACKFSKNKSNLHVIGCSSEYGAIIIQNTLPDYNFSYKINELSKCIINKYIHYVGILNEFTDYTIIFIYTPISKF